MNRTRRTVKSNPSLGLVRLLIVAGLLGGLFGMHGLSRITAASMPTLGANSVATAMPMPGALASFVATPAADAVVSVEAALPPMPMPGGPGSHDMLHGCLAVLSALVALLLLVMALTRDRAPKTLPDLRSCRSRHRDISHRHKPLRLSLTQLGISRT